MFGAQTGFALGSRRVTDPLRPTRSQRAAVACLLLLGASGAWADESPVSRIRISKDRSETSTFAPLERVVAIVESSDARARIRVTDGKGHRYVDGLAEKGELRFQILGALGMHTIELYTKKATLLRQEMVVDAETQIETASRTYDRFFLDLKATVQQTDSLVVDGRSVRYFLPTLRGNTQVLRAGRYLDDDVHGLLPLLLKHQKENGSLLSRVRRDDAFDPYSGTYPGVDAIRDVLGEAYTDRSQDKRTVFSRIPVDADIEALAVSHLYWSWQSTGDDRFMAAQLPGLEKALDYLMSDPVRWDAEHGLVKRGFTLDLFNVQNIEVANLSPTGNRNPAGWSDWQWVDEKTPMGIMHGDNSALYEAAILMSRMLAHLRRDERSAHYQAVAARIRESLERVSWNGNFYRHHVRLWTAPDGLDLGANEGRQISFSNPLAIRRGIATHAQSVAIIREYLRRRERHRDDRMAEWFTIDPPFQKRFGFMEPGEFVNGTITPALAGDLACAAFEHGFETYGVDILNRVSGLMAKRGRLAPIYPPGRRPFDWKPESFTTIDLRGVANRSLRGDDEYSFIGHPSNDLREFPTGRRDFLGKPFEVVEPRTNGGRAAVVLWAEGNLGPRETTLTGITRTAGSVYFLQSSGNHTPGARVGEYEIRYEDGSRMVLPLWQGRNIDTWWAERDASHWQIAWRGRNPHVSRVAMGVWGWTNPYPDKIISSITARAIGNGRLHLLGITLSNVPVQFERDELKVGFPDAWAGAPVFSSLVEGLAGVADKHKVMEHVLLSPRWIAAGEKMAHVTIRYPSSSGYVSYTWEHVVAERRLVLAVTGSGARIDLHVQLPQDAQVRKITYNGADVRFTPTRIEETPYADLSIEGFAGGAIEIRY